MPSLLYPVLIVIATWWIGTGVVLYLQQRLVVDKTPLAITLLSVALFSIVVLQIASGGFSAWQSYSGFISAVVLWGCIELSYYTGLIAGVHKRQCPENCSNTRRFRLALGASLWHEISVLVCALLVTVVSWQAQNPVGLYTFLVLWLMRWSAKLNLFLGVPNFNADWFPQHLAYAHSYMKRSSVSLFFPLSVLSACAVAVNWMMSAVAAPPAQALGIALPCVLLLLAILEHLFMALPIADSALWNRIFAKDDAVAQALASTTEITSDTTISSRSVQPLSGASPPDSVSITLGRVDAATPKILCNK